MRTAPRRPALDHQILADKGLIDAVNVALLLGQPLLLTGEPGTGKTQLAYYLAWELDLGKLKGLALNSLKYSALDEEEKQRALEYFEVKWGKFVVQALQLQIPK